MTFDTTIDPILRAPAAAQRGRADCSDLTSDRLIRPPHVHRRDYDAEGRRVRRTVGSTTTYYVYGADGQLMAEYGGTPNPVGTQYLVPDHLGSTRLILNAQGGCAQRLDYAPYGAQLTRPGADCYTTPATGLPLFTGQMRDPESAAGTETGLDYFNARYFWATLGRFTSPDAPFADQYPDDPQSWNLYGYGLSNPLAFIDPTGRCKKGADSMYHDSEEGPCVAPGGTSITVGADDDIPLSPYAMAFYNEMSRRRMASNQMIVAVAGGSAAVGVTGGTVAYLSGATSGSGLTTLGVRSGHGAFRLALRGFTETDVALTKSGNVLRQADGAKVFIKTLDNGKFNVIVEGKHGVVTALKNISQVALQRLATKHGWK